MAHPNTAKSASAEPRSYLRSAIEIAICMAGIYFFYGILGVFQEHIGLYTKKSVPEGMKYAFTFSQMSIQCFINAFIGYVVLFVTGSKLSPPVSLIHFFVVAFSYLGAMFSSNFALNYISYPTQVLVKSCKIIPVIVVSSILFGKRYPITKWIACLLVTGGLVMYTMYGKKGSDGSSSSSELGLALAALSLFFDGFTPSLQDKIVADVKRRDGGSPSPYHLMTYVNVCSCIVATVLLFVSLHFARVNGENVNFLAPFLSGDADGMIAFISQSLTLDVTLDILKFSVASAFGQIFIFFVQANYGGLSLSIITTTRKFFTMRFSDFLHSRVNAPLQDMGSIIVFVALLGDTLMDYMARKSVGEKKQK